MGNIYPIFGNGVTLDADGTLVVGGTTIEAATDAEVAAAIAAAIAAQHATDSGLYAAIRAPYALGGAAWSILGDSLANNGEGVGYWLAALSKQQFCFPSAAYIKSHPGYTSTQIAALTTEITSLAKPPRYCLVSVGSNDAATGVATATYMTNIQTICNALRAAGVTPVLLNVPPRTAVYGLIPEYNMNLFKYAALNGIGLVDQYSLLVDPATEQYLSVYNSDGIHPNAAGCKAVASKIITDIGSALPLAMNITALACSGMNIHPAATMLIDTNADGIADGFGATLSTGYTCSRVSDAGGFYWQRGSLSGATGVKTITGPTMVATATGSTLAAGASAAATSLSLTTNPGAGGSVFKLAGANGTYEYVRISSISGSGPYTATLSSTTPLKMAHLTGQTLTPAFVAGDTIAYAVRVRSSANGDLVPQFTAWTTGQGAVTLNAIVTSPNSTHGFTQACADAICYAEVVLPASTVVLGYSFQLGNSVDGDYDFALPTIVNLTAAGLA